MELHWIDISIIVVYIALVITIGWLISKRASKDLEAYFLGGKSLPWWVIGTSHGAYKFSGSQGLHFDVLEKIQKVLPEGFPLVMHGSSSVPKEWVDRINKAGGAMKDSSGVPEDQYLPAAKLGVCKVNIDTDGRLVWCAMYRESFRDKPEDFDPRTPGKPFMVAYAQYIAHKNRKLGSAGQLESLRKSLGAACGCK